MVSSLVSPPFTLDTFISYTGWKVPAPHERIAMQFALNYLQRTIPLAVLGRRADEPGPWELPPGGVLVICRLMQSFDFTHPLGIARVDKGARLLCYQTAKQDKQGRWYTLPGTTADRLAVQKEKNIPLQYEAIRPFECLTGKVADAHVHWVERGPRMPSEYASGGGQQFFVPNPAEVLRAGA